ncbi:hypothetical protein [Thiomicrorhabdus sp. Milos-T2]|uniref:hypothetical protein n=1 Tax=Thiomicrorhabdus sp. Milos-T2 TaxID=90814 RepID=UPI000494D3F1|nr:hypothetical protein [Thiomicrorhabdus sp. Milos-T2]
MAEEENYFNELMNEFGFESITHDFVRFLNRHIKRGNLELYYHVGHPWEEEFLKEQNYSSVAYRVYGRAVLKELDFEAIDESILYDELAAVGPMHYKAIFIDGENYYPAHLEGVSEFPSQVSDHVYVVGAHNASSVYVKSSSAPMNTGRVKLTKENYDQFKLKYELELSQKTPEKRRIMLKAFLEKEDYDTTEEILFENHHYSSRLELWEKLSEFDPKLFPRYQESSMQKLFNGNPYISFDKSKK